MEQIGRSSRPTGGVNATQKPESFPAERGTHLIADAATAVEVDAHRARVCEWRGRRLAAKCRQTERRQARARKGAA